MELVMLTMAVNPIENAMMPVYGEQSRRHGLQHRMPIGPAAKSRCGKNPA
jgi:hypothetical protein